MAYARRKMRDMKLQTYADSMSSSPRNNKNIAREEKKGAKSAMAFYLFDVFGREIQKEINIGAEDPFDHLALRVDNVVLRDRNAVG